MKAPYEIKFNLLSILSKRRQCWQLLSKEPLQLLLALSCWSYIIVTRLLQPVLLFSFSLSNFRISFYSALKVFLLFSLFFFFNNLNDEEKQTNLLSCSLQSIELKKTKNKKQRNFLLGILNTSYSTCICIAIFRLI